MPPFLCLFVIFYSQFAIPTPMASIARPSVRLLACPGLSAVKLSARRSRPQLAVEGAVLSQGSYGCELAADVSRAPNFNGTDCHAGG